MTITGLIASLAGRPMIQVPDVDRYMRDREGINIAATALRDAIEREAQAAGRMHVTTRQRINRARLHYDARQYGHSIRGRAGQVLREMEGRTHADQPAD